MKHQRPNLDTLPPLPILRARNLKCRMRHPPRPSILLRVKALDQNDFLRRESRLIEPPSPC